MDEPSEETHIGPEPKSNHRCNPLATARSGHLGCWCRLGILLFILVGIEGTCQALYQYQRRCPAVTGVVVDRDTDLPIAGAFVSRQMLGTSRNPLYNIGGTTGPTPLLQFAFQDTDRLGHFSFSKDNTIMKWSESGDPLIYLYGPDIRQAIQIIVYSPEYIPVRSHQAGFVWTKEEWLSLDQEQTQDMRNPKWKVVGPSGFSAERTGSLRTGYQYRIEMVKAVTEAQWQEKCHETWLLNNLYIPKKVSDKWMFTDLTGYLESWPGGEKAGEYLHLLLNAVAVGCDGSNADTTMRELSEGDGGRREVIGVVERNQAILRLASRHGAVISAEDAARVC